MGLSTAASQLASYGRGPDTELAHMSPDEMKFIDYIQGGPRINPHTGLREYGLLGKILKGVARVAGSVVGFMVGGPLGAAAGAGLMTKATGGSWNQALKAGAISGLGSWGMQGLSGGGWSPTQAGAPYNVTSAGDLATGALPEVQKMSLGQMFNDPSAMLHMATHGGGLGATFGALSQPLDSTPAGTTAPQPPVDNFRLPPPQPLDRSYQAPTGDLSKYGTSAMPGEHSFFSNNVLPMIPPKVPMDQNQPQMLADGGPVGLGGGQPNVQQLRQAAMAGYMSMAKGGRVPLHMADGGYYTVPGTGEVVVGGGKTDESGESLGGTPIVIPSAGQGGADLESILNAPVNIANNYSQQAHGFWSGLKDKINEAVKTGAYDISHPTKGLQDILSGMTGLQFKPGNYDVSSDPSKLGGFRLDSQATFNPEGINPLGAAGMFFPPATFANLAMQTAGYDPSIKFSDMMGGLDKAFSPDNINSQFASAMNSPGPTGGIPQPPAQLPPIPTGLGSLTPQQRALLEGGSPYIGQYATGGSVYGPGDGKSDSVPAMLSAGEHVVDAGTVSALGNGDNDAGHRALEQIKAAVRRKAGFKKPRKPSGKVGLGSVMKMAMNGSGM